MGKLKVVVFSCCLALLGGNAFAQAWPAKPLRIVVPFPPGGIADVISRSLAQKMSDDLKQQVVTDNRGGGGQVVGTAHVAQSAPDGYTVLLTSVGHAINATLVPNLPYDSVRDFTPISMVNALPLALVVNASLPANNVGEFVAMARAQPAKLNYASSGTGSGGHLAFELLKNMANVDIVHIPYKGAAPATADLVAGQVQALITGPAVVEPLVKAGKLRILGLTGKARLRQLPDIPTIAESGLPGYDSATWNGITGPKGLPGNVLARLNGSVRQALAAADLREKWESSGMTIQGSTPEEFGTFITAEIGKWRTIVQKANIKPEASDH